MKVVSRFTWYGRFTLISSDWSMSHKGLKPLAQQFPYAAVIHYESLSFTTHQSIKLHERACVREFEHSAPTFVYSPRQNGPLKWRERDQKIPLLTFKPNLAVKVIISAAYANERFSISPIRYWERFEKSPLCIQDASRFLPLHTCLLKMCQKLMTAEHGDWVSNFQVFIS